MNAATNRPRLIIGVLNWGLGHATRCVPLLEKLQQAGFETIISSDGSALQYLREHFPDCETEELPSYSIHYRGNAGALLAVIGQMPKLSIVIRKEHRALKKLVRKYNPIGIISDNRPGFYHKEIPSVYLTHQLKIMLPFARKFASGLHHRYIRRFAECWVPDLPGHRNLAGELSLDQDPGIPTRFIGPLSRFYKHLNSDQPKTFQTCTILSGPEPQRTRLEKLLLQKLGNIPGRHVLVRGTTGGDNPASDSLEIHDFLDGEKLARLLEQSELVISRPGYSSLMDYLFLGNRALLIPTPGQPEQEYLARYMLSRGWFYYVSQDYFDPAKDIEAALDYDGFPPSLREHSAINESLFSLFERE